MILDQFRLDGKVALVTGGNRGLGLGIASALAEAGADIITIQRSDVTTDIADAVAQSGRRYAPITLDLTERTASQQALILAQEQFGHVDILVNNAGIQRRAPAAEFSEADWDLVLQVNLHTVFAFSQTFGREMVRRGSGKIINISSLIAFQGGLFIPAYAASKHAVAGLTKAFCNEWASQGINVNAIAPGYMDTEINAALRADPVRNRSISERIPANRWGNASDLGGAAVFLASGASDYIHGQTIVIDGGWLAR